MMTNKGDYILERPVRALALSASCCHSDPKQAIEQGREGKKGKENMTAKEEVTFFGKMFVGNQVPVGESKERYDGFLLDGETVVYEFKAIRDAMIFTDLRMMVIDPQGIRGKKVSLTSIPWKSITAFSVENSGTFDLDAELKVSGSGFGMCEIQFSKGTNMSDLQAFISAQVVGN